MKNIQYNFMRYEEKYFITKEKIQNLLSKLSEYMISDEYGKTSICNIYYDTPDWRVVRASMGKPVFKRKLRMRSYNIPQKNDEVFLELKKKFDGIVYKRRMRLPIDRVPVFLEKPSIFDSNQTAREIADFQKNYNSYPRVFIGYDRTAFFGKNDRNLRITFDENMRWRTERLDLRQGDDGKRIIDNNLILMEIKISGGTPLWLSKILSEEKIYPVSFSKYKTVYVNNLYKTIKL